MIKIRCKVMISCLLQRQQLVGWYYEKRTMQGITTDALHESISGAVRFKSTYINALYCRTRPAKFYVYWHPLHVNND